MSSTMTSTGSTAEQVVRKHPIRGAIWGLLLGLGLAIYAILFAIIPFTDWVPLILVVLAGVVIGVAWAYLAPAKKPGPPPAAPQPAAAPPEAESMPDEPVDVTPAGGADAPAEPGPDPSSDADAADADAGDATGDPSAGDDPGSADDLR